MNITRKSILGFGMDTSLVNLGWTRNDGKNIDSVEFEIKHKGIEKLERNINSKTEYVMCFVHFNADTEELDGMHPHLLLPLEMIVSHHKEMYIRDGFFLMVHIQMQEY